MSDDTTQRITQGLAKISLAMRHNAWQQAGPRGLNPTQSQILVLLQQHPMIGVGEVARQLAVTSASVSDSVRALVEKKLVKKTTSKKDTRAVTLSLTASGKAEAARNNTWPDLLSVAVDSMSDSERQIFVRSLVKMVRTLQESGKIPVSRMCVSCRFFKPDTYVAEALPHHCDFVNAPFGDAQLRFDCPDHEQSDQPEKLYAVFINGKPAAG